MCVCVCVCECCFERVSACKHPCMLACVQACVPVFTVLLSVSVRVRKGLCVFLFANSGTVSVIALCFGRMRIVICACVSVCV